MTVETTTDLTALFEATNTAELTRVLTVIQTRLTTLAKDKTNATTTTTVSRGKPDEARTQISRAS